MAQWIGRVGFELDILAEPLFAEVKEEEAEASVWRGNKL